MRIVELFDKNSVLGNIEDKVTGAVKSVVGDAPAAPEKAPQSTKTKPVDNSADRNAEFRQEFERQGIKDPYLQNALIGKFHQEAGGKYGVSEIPFSKTNNDRIRTVLPQFKNMSDAELDALKTDDRAFFNKAYGSQLNNTGSDDGYTYRGRGLTGLTGKSNYAAADKALGLGGALVKNPDMLIKDPELDRRVSTWYYKNAGADKQQFSSQEEANKWAIHMAGGKAYAPGTRLGDAALANMNARLAGKDMQGTQLAKAADSVVDKISRGVSSATDYVKSTVSNVGSVIDNPENTIELVIDGKKVKFKNKKEALLALAQAKAQGQDVQGV